MCANCVAQGAAYVGGAVGALQVMRVHARHRLGRRTTAAAVGPEAVPPEDGAPDARATRVTAGRGRDGVRSRPAG